MRLVCLKDRKRQSGLFRAHRCADVGEFFQDTELTRCQVNESRRTRATIRKIFAPALVAYLPDVFPNPGGGKIDLYAGAKSSDRITAVTVRSWICELESGFS